MKNKLIILALFISGLFIACEEDNIEPANFSDAAWYTSIFRTPDNEYKIGIDDFISFSDLSQNVVDHNWTIPGGNFFLEGPITRQDSLLDEFIVNAGDTVSEDMTVHVLFKKSGLQTVKLYNTFTDSVAYRGLDTIPAQQINGKWVIENIFVVDVYDTIVADVSIRQKGAIVPLGSDTIFVEAGDELEFIDITTIGRPDTRSWSVAGESSSDSVATIVFKKLGVFHASFTSSRTGQNIPGDWDPLKIPNPIKVIPSSKPFVLTGDIVELEDETIQVPYNGEFQPFINQEQFFTVKVNDVSFDISSVGINSQDATLLEIKLVDKIYRPDVITVSYAGGDLQSTDTRSAGAFTDVPVVMHDVNLLSQAAYGFEDGGTAWAARWDNNADFEFTTDKAASGTYSVKVDKKDGQANGGIESVNAQFDLEAGKTYVYRYKVWVDPSSAGNGTFDTWYLGQWKHFWVDAVNVPKGEWHTVTHEYTAGADETTRIFVRILDTGIYYFDDFYIVEKEERP
ncbi:carbohydrate binding domain-containing protein [Fulvivirgaceae bacterium BMA12]|uniref:Carbohydrate binding domain-containing protein n=1 Tax=Agaribacillus aureus TaxID=3051825 RepID=A0ABT8L219_9BACT|nr:carbohydrate binding domain-containing protein [Fulvivirgaceae bacterium BMA12]